MSSRMDEGLALPQMKEGIGLASFIQVSLTIPVQLRCTDGDALVQWSVAHSVSIDNDTQLVSLPN